jgi:hypothetical protein
MAIQRRREDSFDDKKQTSGQHIGCVERPLIVQSHSDPTPTRISELLRASVKEDAEFRVTVPNPALHTYMQSNESIDPHRSSTLHHSPSSSRISSRPSSSFGGSRRSRPSLTSSLTSTTISVDVRPERKNTEPSTRRPSLRPSLKARLRSSLSSHRAARPSIHPSKFQNDPEQPEKHFIDSIGMVIPGVCSRTRCEHPRAHFVSHWRLCEPIEYTTSLADHGITYTDYSRLIGALLKGLDDTPSEPKRRHRDTPWWILQRRKASRDDDFPGNERQSEYSSVRRQSFWRGKRRQLCRKKKASR